MNLSLIKFCQVIGFLLLIGLLSGCSDRPTFKPAVNLSSSQTPLQPKDPTVNPNADPAIERTIEVVLKTIQPTLAVRGIACLMCHADIRSNVVSDFGFGNTWYLGGEGATLDNTQTPYGNIASAWQSARNIYGSVIIPQANAIRSVQNILGAAFRSPAPLVSLKTLMSTGYDPAYNFDNDPAQIGKAMDLKIMPDAGNEKLIEKTKIVIRAPDESEINALVGDGNPFVNKGSYFMNDESAVLDCSKKDLVVKGVLYLRNLRVRADGGCRIYATGSVFIENAITYVGAGANPNLQITSSNAIVMGFNLARLRNRVLTDARGAQLGYSFKSYSERANQLVADAAAIGVLKDAQDDNSPRAAIDYTGLLLNAPMVHSRYLGKIQGTIIAENALFALGQFHFQFDQVFTKVDVLPLIVKPIIEIQ